jgi:phenylacetic acid degradation operon negative regulatory protein
MSAFDEMSADPSPRSGELEPILAYINAGPSRSWSLIITILGDCVVPRHGAVWLGTFLEIFRGLGLTDGVVRTAMSRLTADHWLERTKVGRNSFYRLAAEGRSAFDQASDKIYSRRPPPWAGHFDMVLVEAGNADLTSRLWEVGFGSPSPGVFIAPAGTGCAPTGFATTARLKLSGEPADMEALAAQSWTLAATADAYHRFLSAFAPLSIALNSGLVLSDRDAVLARTLLIHAWRRIVLRDPLLPPEVLASDWPGTPARVVCASIYHRLLVSSERWLDSNAIGEDGAPLPGNPAVVGARFRD